MIEYRIKPVTRYIVTRFESGDKSVGCRERGEFDNIDTAWAVAYALCKLEHDNSGEPPGSMNFIYPWLEPPAAPPPQAVLSEASPQA